MSVKYYITDTKRNKFLEKHTMETDKSGVKCGVKIVRLFPEMTYQTAKGFGGAFTESAAVVFAKLSAEKQDELIKLLFDEETGIGFNFGRTHIGSCDFSLDAYSYTDEGDMTLNTFDISREKKAVIPMIESAKRYCKNLRLFSSPWSPPAYMKDNNSLFNGGKLKKEFYALWTDYVLRYIDEMKNNGIEIDAVTVQNEPAAAMPWESCEYSAQDEAELIKSGYGEKMKQRGIDIYVWDHNKEVLLDRAWPIFNDPDAAKYVTGIACHWYAGEHFEQLGMFSELWPDKEIVFSEGCRSSEKVGTKPPAEALKFADDYAHEIIGDIRNGMSAYCTWNLMLDEKNGPYHNRPAVRSCDAPIIVDTQRDEFYLEPSYYYIGHFSKFIKRGAKRIGISVYNTNLETVAFSNPDGSVVCVALNRTDDELVGEFVLGMEMARIAVAPHSVCTIVFDGIAHMAGSVRRESL